MARIENRHLVPLDLLAELFPALARDYRQQTRGELVLADVRSGSIIAILADLAGYAEQAKQPFDFAMTFRNIVGSILSGELSFPSRRRAVVKSALALAEVAVRGTANVQIQYRGGKGEELIVSVIPNPKCGRENAGPCTSSCSCPPEGIL